MKKRISALLAILMVVSLVAGMPGPSAQAAETPAAIQDTYEIDGVTYFNVGSRNFAVQPEKFYKDLIGSRSRLIAQQGDYDYDEYQYRYYDQSIADLWLQLGAMLMTDLTPDLITSREIMTLRNAAQRGSDFYALSGGDGYYATRYDVESHSSLRDAENWVFRTTFGQSKNFGYFRSDTADQPVLAAAVTTRRSFSSTTRFTIGAYFTNFRVYALMPADEGTNYVTEIISDNVNSQSTTASTVKNLTASTVTGSQSVSNSTTATVSSSVSGSESYSFTEGFKVGAEYQFTKFFKVNGELSFSATQAFASGWGESKSLSDTKSASYSVSIPLAPYTQAMMTQTDTTAVYLTSYNCPIALKYDVTLVMYETDDLGGGLMRQTYIQPAVDREMVYTFSDARYGAIGNLNERINSCESWSAMDDQSVRWRAVMERAEMQYDMYGAVDSINTLRSHAPMSSTGASYYQTLNVVASEVSGLMPTHPLYRVKIAQPDVAVSSGEVNYLLFDYFTANMEVGDFSYTNYMTIVGFNKYDVPFYGFSKDNGYWIVTDKQGNPLSEEESPVKLEKDPVSTNWRYTAIRPGTCFLVYRIDEDAYFIADKPDQPIRNEDLAKTAALEIIVTEKDPTDTIVISGSYQGHPNVAPEPLDADGRLTAAVYDETGKEIEKPYTWEARELKGISVTEDGQVSFTKDGAYHVRAVNGNLRSDWYEITAGHTPSVVRENVVAPTCTEPGSCDLVTSCSVCGEELGREHVLEPALGHSFDAGTVTVAPTNLTNGVKTYTCTQCGMTVTESIPKLTHTELYPQNPPNTETPLEGPHVPVQNPFEDVSDGDYFLDPVLWALYHDPQITNGTSDTTFSPGVTCTRGQIVTFLWRAKGCPEPQSSSNPFTDVASDAYYCKAVLWANEQGITDGTSATTFSPEDPCTRAHVVTFLWRAEGQPPADSSSNPFSDVPAGRYFTDAVLWAVSNGITDGISPTTFGPDNPCTRGQAVTFLYRGMKETGS